MVVSEHRTTNNRKIGIRANKIVRKIVYYIKELGKHCPVYLHWNVAVIKGYAMLIVIAVGRILKWPMSVVRLSSPDKNTLAECCDKLLSAWRGYSDPDAFIFAETDGVPHNTITPIARFRNGKYELDLVLRNNITTEEFPDGVYHPHPQHHHIKKENIGLIEVMGLAVLPSRLKTEMAVLQDALVNNKDIAADERIAKHLEWAEQIKKDNNITAENCEKILQDEIGKVFADILGQCGVYARNEEGKAQFIKFTDYINE